MVESAIYFPFIVLGIMFTIYVMIDMYSIASLQAHLHISVRAESGSLSGVTEADVLSGASGYDRYRDAAFAKKIKLGKGTAKNTKTATGAVTKKYSGGRMVGSVKVGMNARAYSIKEMDGIRSLIRK
jgi:hypothetical protein